MVATRKMGFRHVALITVNDTDAGIAGDAASMNGTGQLTMFFRVNGAVVYARGGNKVCFKFGFPLHMPPAPLFIAPPTGSQSHC